MMDYLFKFVLTLTALISLGFALYTLGHFAGEREARQRQMVRCQQEVNRLIGR